uniref:DH domain-containing protein n=1 Tax=Hippocampus comes TaxID=109280 RepID=A0A3Q2YPE2_HIPCM
EGTARASAHVEVRRSSSRLKLRHIVEEMVTTEREYVRSLRYVIAHYFPEMERADLPQDLRGKRSVVFGNLEKLLDFHAHIFLQELEACWKHPLRVAHCFLRHEQFGLYALYSKNKPKSDALLASRGLAFFKVRKQRELGDRMDLCSYLLKPVQRMSKYALLLDDLIKEAGAAQEAERTSLRTALAAVKFQLRHGNDLLAMDAIRRCDVRPPPAESRHPSGPSANGGPTPTAGRPEGAGSAPAPGPLHRLEREEEARQAGLPL